MLVGLPEPAVRESIHRIERALANLGYDRHPGRTVINLAPADLRKDAGGFDLPMRILSGQLPVEPIVAEIQELFARLNSYDVDFADF